MRELARRARNYLTRAMTRAGARYERRLGTGTRRNSNARGGSGGRGH